MKSCRLLFAVLAALVLLGLSRTATAAADENLVVRATKAYIGDGNFLDGGVRLFVRNGKIESLGPDKGPLPAGYKVIDRRGLVLIPGLVAATTNIVNTPADRPLAPDLQAHLALNLTTYQPELLKAGITTFHIAPNRGCFLPGQGSLVKPARAGGFARVLVPGADLILVLGESGKSKGKIYDPILFPDENNFLQPAEFRMPGSLATQGALARMLFTAYGGAKAPAFVQDKSMGWSTAALKTARLGQLPIRIVCDSPAAARLATNLAWEWGLSPIIEDTRVSGKVTDFTGPKPRAIIVRIPVNLWAANSGDPKTTDPAKRPDPTYAARLHAAGYPIILTPIADRDLNNLRLAAGVAVRSGLSPAAALRAITLEPALALGVADRIGSLRAGRDGDFILLSGEPFDARTAVTEVFIDGTPSWSAPKKQPIMVIKAGEVRRGDGKVFKPGMVIVKGNKIMAAGSNLTVPPGATVLDRPSAVVTPGMIDVDSRLGLHGKLVTRSRFQRINGMFIRRAFTESILNLGPEVDLSKLVDVTEVGFGTVMRSGVTSTIVASNGGKSRGSLFKTAKPAKTEALVSPIAALHTSLSSAKSLLGMLAKAGAYQKKVDAYKKSYAAWQKKRFGPAERPAKPFIKPKAATKKAAPKTTAKKPTGKKTPAKPTPAKSGIDPVGGTWKGSIVTPKGKAPCKLMLKSTAGKVVGTFEGPFRIRRGGKNTMPLTGTFKGGKLTLATKSRQGMALLSLEATVSGNHMEGTWAFMGGRMKGTFSADREKVPSAPFCEKLSIPAGAMLTLAEILDIDEMEFPVPPELEDSMESEFPALPVPGFAVLALADPITGKWEGKLSLTPTAPKLGITLNLKLAGKTVTGDFGIIVPGRPGAQTKELNGTYESGSFRFTVVGQPVSGEATVSPDHMAGSFSLGPMKGQFTADRVSGGGSKSSATGPEKKSDTSWTSPAGGAPKPPKKDEKIIPWVAVLTGKAALIMHPANAAALQDALPELQKKFKLTRLVVTDSGAARESLAVLAATKTAVLIPPGASYTKEWAGPTTYTNRGIPILFGSGTAEGSRWLGLHAAYAVSRSLSPEDALKALTLWPGRYLAPENRVGLLAPGWDADLVVWSGDPFDLAARVTTVLIHGKVVYKNDE